MTDSQKLDLILSEITDMKGHMSHMDGEINGLKDEIARMNGEINGLKNGQRQIRMDVRNVANRLEDTYHLALEAWGNSIENRELLTQ